MSLTDTEWIILRVSLGVGVPILWILLLYLRLLPSVVMRVWFMFTFAWCMIIMAVGTLLIDVFRMVGIASRYRTTRMCTALCVFFFRFQITANPQIRIHRPSKPSPVPSSSIKGGSAPLPAEKTLASDNNSNSNGKALSTSSPLLPTGSTRTRFSSPPPSPSPPPPPASPFPLRYVSWEDIPKGAMLLGNHTTIMDPFTMCAITPLSFVANGRPMYKATLNKIPFFGGIFTRSGYFPVYFTRNDSGSFSVDKVKQEQVYKDMEYFASKEKGSLALFPEGRVNPNPDSDVEGGGVLPVRWGSIKIALEHRIPIVLLAMWGSQSICPFGKVVGGFPADVHYVLGTIEPDELREAARRKKDDAGAIPPVDKTAAPLPPRQEGSHGDGEPNAITVTTIDEAGDNNKKEEDDGSEDNAVREVKDLETENSSSPSSPSSPVPYSPSSVPGMDVDEVAAAEYVRMRLQQLVDEAKAKAIAAGHYRRRSSTGAVASASAVRR